MHPSLAFTFEDGTHFLDVNLHRDGSSFKTSVYRKPTFTGLYINYNAFCPKQYKVNLVRSLYDRGRRICSPPLFDKEATFLRVILSRNGYPHWFIDKYSQPANKQSVPTVPKKPILFAVQYVGEASTRETIHIKKTVERAYPHLRVVPWFRTCRLAANAPKDPIPAAQRPLVVYNYRCACGASYVGRTERTLEQRMKEHIPKWCAAGKSRPRSQQPPSSSITHHHLTCPQTASRDNFRVVKFCRTALELRISEAVLIRLTRPSLCVQKDFTYTCDLLP